MRRRDAALLVALGAPLAACTRTMPTRYYTLETELPPPPRRRPLSLALAEVGLPDYLDRPEIVTRPGAMQMQIAEFDRWSGSLKLMVQRVLGEALSRASGADEMILLPQYHDLRYDTLVDVQIQRFDVDAAGQAVLETRTRLFGAGGNKLISSRAQHFTERGAPPPNYVGVVAAMSRTIDDLARSVAASLPPPKRR